METVSPEAREFALIIHAALQEGAATRDALNDLLEQSDLTLKSASINLITLAAVMAKAEGVDLESFMTMVRVLWHGLKQHRGEEN
jgi:hypothetical protein